MIYIASPFSHKSQAVEAIRMAQVSRYAHKLMLTGQPAFSPIVYGFYFYSTYSFPGDAETWKAFNEQMLSSSEEMHVYMLDGWKTSKGVTAEISFAQAHKIHIEYIEPVL